MHKALHVARARPTRCAAMAIATPLVLLLAVRRAAGFAYHSPRVRWTMPIETFGQEGLSRKIRFAVSSCSLAIVVVPPFGRNPRLGSSRRRSGSRSSAALPREHAGGA